MIVQSHKSQDVNWTYIRRSEDVLCLRRLLLKHRIITNLGKIWCLQKFVFLKFRLFCFVFCFIKQNYKTHEILFLLWRKKTMVEKIKSTKLVCESKLINLELFIKKIRKFLKNNSVIALKTLFWKIYVVIYIILGVKF